MVCLHVDIDISKGEFGPGGIWGGAVKSWCVRRVDDSLGSWVLGEGFIRVII